MFRLLLILIGFSYFVGMIWYVYVQVCEQIQMDMGEERENIYSFTNEYSLDAENKSDKSVVIILTYYSLTTLSSVGFGDYYP